MGKSLFRILLMIPGVTWCLAQAPAPTWIDTAQTLVSAKQTYTIRFQPSPQPIPLNQPFILDVWIQYPDDRPSPTLTLSVDARMPEHRHGMVRHPSVTHLDHGHYRISDLLFHMPGRWEIYFDITYAGVTERAWTQVILE